MKTIIGRKVGMTQVFLTDGSLVPVSVVEVLPNIVLQKKTVATDGYFALKVGFEEKKESRSIRPDLGQFKSAATTPKQFVNEIKGDELEKYEVGQAVCVDIFSSGEIVDVSGINKGKGFSGNIFRNNQKIGPKSHGSGLHRTVGSLANNGRDNNRVLPGKKMPGHEGHKKVTVLNLAVVGVDKEQNVILLKGAIPGPKKGLITIRSAVKAQLRKPKSYELVSYKEVENA
jgi:large subunit ribosomal protein L3